MKSCPKCKKRKHIVGVEYGYGSPERYDGISEWVCMKPAGCGYRQGRWSGKELKGNDVEKRFGGKP